MAFVKAEIPVENAETFAKLKDAISTALSQHAEAFLKATIGAKLKVRDFEGQLKESVIDRACGLQKGSAQNWYMELSLSDQGLAREFFLTQVELIDPALRNKYKAAYRYQ